MSKQKKWRIIVTLALLVGFVVVGLRPDEPDVLTGSGPSSDPVFAFKVIKPRLARPVFGILPLKLEEKLEPGAERLFNQTSPGNRIGNISANRIELSADDWSLVIETDSAGKLSAETHLVYTMSLAEKVRKLRCRPDNPATGYLLATPRISSDKLDGRFRVELATCEDTETGKVIGWPPRPLTVRGSFKGLPLNAR